MSETTSSPFPAGNSQAPTEDNPFATISAPDLSGLSPEQALSKLDGWKASIGTNAKHAFFDAAHPQHRAVLAHWDELHRAAYPEGSAPASAETNAELERPMGDSESRRLIADLVVWSAARFDGQPLAREDQAAAADLLHAAFTELKLPRNDASRFNIVLSNALRATSKGQTTYEAGTAALEKQLGAAGAQATIAAANQVLAHLDAAGLNVGQALQRSGAANSPDLVRELARLAPRVTGRRG
jgi:hypothetical protein